MKCHRAYDKELRTWVHIPGCDGAAYNGPDQCTCDFTLSRKERGHRDRISTLLREKRELVRLLAEARRERARLWNENTRMRTGRAPEIEVTK